MAQLLHSYRKQSQSSAQLLNEKNMLNTLQLRRDSSIKGGGTFNHSMSIRRRTKTSIGFAKKPSNASDMMQILTIRILVVGQDGAGHQKIIEKFGAESQDDMIKMNEVNYTTWTIPLEDEFDQFNVRFFEPIDKDLSKFLPLFEKSLKVGEFDGIIMICSHKDEDGNFLKSSIDYLGELQQSIVVKSLPQLPKVVLVNNEIIAEHGQEISNQAYQFQDPTLKQAKKFAKKSLKCKAFKINQLGSDSKIQSQIDNGFTTLIDEVLNDLAQKGNKKSRIKDTSIKSTLQAFTKMTGADKIKKVFQFLVVFQCVTSLAQAFISVKLTLSIINYVEAWVCNANNLSGFFCFFGAVIGFYGVKYQNKEYLKTYQMTSITDIFFNIEAVILYIVLMGMDQDHFLETHYRFIWINIAQLVFSLSAFTMSCFIKSGIIKQLNQRVQLSAEICDAKRKSRKVDNTLQFHQRMGQGTITDIVNEVPEEQANSTLRGTQAAQQIVQEETESREGEDDEEEYDSLETSSIESDEGDDTHEQEGHDVNNDDELTSNSSLSYMKAT